MFTNKTPWIVLLLLWMGGSTWWHVCKIKQLCDEAPASAAASAPVVTMPPLSIVDSDKLNLNVTGNFSFAESGAVANQAAVGNTLQTVASHLIATGRTLTLTGYYFTDEQNPTAFANLGLARAEAIKAKLLALGVPAAQLTTKGVALGGVGSPQLAYSPRRDSVYGGLTFAFDSTGVAANVPVADTVAAETPKTEQELAEAQKFESVFKPIDLYFKYAQSDYIRTDDTKEFFTEARTYLREHRDKKLILTGHTDDEGTDEENIELARKRANAVKDRLKRFGIDGDQIEVNAKGESEPKASNETEEGRKANRRVTVVVQ